MDIEVVSLGELLVEIFRKHVDQPFDQPGDFAGPYPSGAPAIFIDALAKLGCKCGFLATVGDDDFGRYLIDRMKKYGIDTSKIFVLSDYTTGVAFTVFFGDGSRKFIYHSRHAATGHFGPEHIDRDYISKARYLHITGNVLTISSSARQACYRAVEIIKRAGGKISFDPNIRPEMMAVEKIREVCQPILTAAYLVLPSGPELEMLTGIGNVQDACKALLSQGVHIIALKDGAKGSTVYTGNRTLRAPAFTVREIDPTGAGDCYDAGFVYGLLQGWGLEKTARFANALGALTVTKQGAMEADISLADVMKFINQGKVK